MKTIIFTDLDGTFLNHDNYSYQDSLQALNSIFQKEIPLIFTTSKTKIEIEKLQDKIQIREPFIVENGAAIFIPKNYKNLDFSFLAEFDDKYFIYQLGLKYEEILNFYNTYKKEFGIFGFSDMNNWELMKYTNLNKEEIKLSKQRKFTEPFILNDKSRLNELEILAAKFDMKITQGGRFYHLLGVNQDKGKAVVKAIEILEKVYNEKIKSIGLGDGPNDIDMLKSVDIPIIIRNYKDEYIKTSIKNIQKSKYKGSAGWNEMVLKNV